MMEYHEGSNNFLLRRRTNEWLEVIDELFLTRLFLTYSYLPCRPRSIQSSWNFNPNVIISINPPAGDLRFDSIVPSSYRSLSNSQKPVRCMISNVREDNGRASKPIIIIFRFVNNNCRVSVTTTAWKILIIDRRRRIICPIPQTRKL